MPVPINPPIVTDAVPAKTFDQWFYTDFKVTGLSANAGDLSFTKVPQSSITGETLAAQSVNVSVPFWSVVAALSSASAALQAVLTALPEVEAWTQAD